MQDQEYPRAFPYEVGEVLAYREGSAGWSFATIRSGDVTLRHTDVFHLQHGEWKLVHAHVSIPVANEDAARGDADYSVG